MNVFMNYCYMAKLVMQYLKKVQTIDPKDEPALRVQYTHEFLKREGIEVTYDRPEALDIGRPCIYVANHSAMIDPVVATCQMPFTIRFLVKDTLFRFPLLKTALKIEKHIPVHRGSGRKTDIDQIRQAVSTALKNGDRIFVFPEGTRTATGKMGPFKLGAFFNAVQNNVPIVPIAIHGMFDLNPKTSFAIKSGKCSIHVFDPIEVPDGSDERQRAEKMRDMAHAIILNDLEGKLES